MQLVVSNSSRWGKGSFLPLLVCLLSMFLLVPLATNNPLILTLGVGVLFIAGVVPLAGNLRLLISFCITGAIVVALRWLAHARGSEYRWLVLLSHLAIAGQLAFLGWIVIARVMTGARVTSNELLGAVCGYLLIGFLFGFLYAALLDIDSDAIEHSVRQTTLDDLTGIGRGVPELVFYSFTTLTTVGYGDILPRRPMAKSFAMLEAVIGQLYLVLLVARLVGAMGSWPRSENHQTRQDPS